MRKSQPACFACSPQAGSRGFSPPAPPRVSAETSWFSPGGSSSFHTPRSRPVQAALWRGHTCCPPPPRVKAASSVCDFRCRLCSGSLGAPQSHPHRAAAPGTCCGGAQKPWSSEEACGQHFRLPSWTLLRLWGLWPGPDWVTCGERRVPCPFTLSSARLPPPKLLASSPPAEPVAILSAPEASFDTPPRPH